jgi:hypothetical protein
MPMVDADDRGDPLALVLVVALLEFSYALFCKHAVLRESNPVTLWYRSTGECWEGHLWSPELPARSTACRLASKWAVVLVAPWSCGADGIVREAIPSGAAAPLGG